MLKLETTHIYIMIWYDMTYLAASDLEEVNLTTMPIQVFLIAVKYEVSSSRSLKALKIKHNPSLIWFDIFMLSSVREKSRSIFLNYYFIHMQTCFSFLNSILIDKMKCEWKAKVEDVLSLY